MLTRRSVLFGLLAAPAIIKTPGLLMPVRKIEPAWEGAVTGRWTGPSWKQLEELPPGTYTGKIVGMDYAALESRVLHMVFEIDDAQQPRWIGTRFTA